MELRRLRYFVVVARHLHFGRAAEELGVAQPGLSQQIKTLEKELGARLFDRDRRGVALTRAGEVLEAEATALLNQAEALRRRVGAAGRGATGVLRIAYTRSGADLASGDLVRAFSAAHPGVDVELHTGWTSWNLEALRNHEVDLAFVRGRIHHKGVSSITVAHEELVVAVADHHALAKLPEIPPEKLRDEPIVMWRRRQGPEFYDELVDQLWPESDLHVSAWEPEAEQILAAVADGTGLAVLDRHRAMKLRPHGVTLRPITGGGPIIAIRLAHRTDDHTPTVRQFLGWCRHRTTFKET